jgi:hypothetical protein
VHSFSEMREVEKVTLPSPITKSSSRGEKPTDSVEVP